MRMSAWRIIGKCTMSTSSQIGRQTFSSRSAHPLAEMAENLARSESMSEYERQRAMKIAQNRQLLMDLDLHSIRQDLAVHAESVRTPTKRAPVRGLKSTPKRAHADDTAGPMRRSLRTRGFAPDGEAVLLPEEISSSTNATGVVQEDVLSTPLLQARPLHCSAFEARTFLSSLVGATYSPSSEGSSPPAKEEGSSPPALPANKRTDASGLSSTGTPAPMASLGSAQVVQSPYFSRRGDDSGAHATGVATPIGSARLARLRSRDTQEPDSKGRDGDTTVADNAAVAAARSSPGPLVRRASSRTAAAVASAAIRSSSGVLKQTSPDTQSEQVHTLVSGMPDSKHADSAHVEHGTSGSGAAGAGPVLKLEHPNSAGDHAAARTSTQLSPLDPVPWPALAPPSRTTDASLLALVRRMSISERTVAKVTPHRTFSTAMHPAHDKVVVMVGDKWGHVGLWDVHATLSAQGAGGATSARARRAAVDEEEDAEEAPGEDDARAGGAPPRKSRRSRGAHTATAHAAEEAADTRGSTEPSGEQQEEEDDDAATSSSAVDGVYLFKPHTRPVVALHCVPWDQSRIVSTSYDGTVRVGHLRQGVFEMIHQSEEGGGYSCMDILLGRSDGALVFLDARASSTTPSTGHVLPFHTRRVSHCAWNWADPHFFATASNDCTARVWDVRMLGGIDGLSTTTAGRSPKAIAKACVATVEHKRGVCGNMLVTVSLDDTIRVTRDPSKAAVAAHTIHHNNNTGRWLSTFKPAFDPKHNNVFAVGAMRHPRAIDVFDASAGSLLRSLQDNEEYHASVTSLHAFHPTHNALAGSNSSGKVFVWMA